MEKQKMYPVLSLLVLAGCVFQAAAFDPAVDAKDYENSKTQRIRLKEDDAQNYMTSKIYELKHVQANDLVPFILGAVKRYARNSSCDRINYPAGKQQLLSVTCPVRMMPYVDDMIAKLDRPGVALDANGSGIAGTGITRSVYTPSYRSTKAMVDVMIKAGIPSNATSGSNQDALVEYDSKSNLIYWKDSARKDQDLKKYLAWLDRPLPQANIEFQIYEIREGMLRDLGVDYLAWKNGPGLEIFGAGYNSLSASFSGGSDAAALVKTLQAILKTTPKALAMGSKFSPYAGFFFAPAFDMSFIRLLQQDGKATIASSGSLTILNKPAGSYELSFDPEYQNLVKRSSDKNFVDGSKNGKLLLKITNPVICFSGAANKDGLLPYTVEDYLKTLEGTVNFEYAVDSKNVVERNNYGNELLDASFSKSYVTMNLRNEKVLARWTKETEVEQTIGVPFLSELPILKYIFGTTTTNKETIHYILSARIELIHPDEEIARIAGQLKQVPELFETAKK